MNKLIHFRINGQEKEMLVDVGESLVDMLRNKLFLTGVKKGCEVGECGACTVIIDGETYDSCIYLAAWADGKDIRTVESLAQKNGELSKVQKAFVEEGAVQCGFCTPGILMTATNLLEKGNDYSDAELQKKLSGHLCRCTGYQNILVAVKEAMKE